MRGDSLRSKPVPRRSTTSERTHSSPPMKAYMPSSMTVSISKVISLPEASTRSYTCSMYSAGASIRILMTPENTPMCTKLRL